MHLKCDAVVDENCDHIMSKCLMKVKDQQEKDKQQLYLILQSGTFSLN